METEIRYAKYPFPAVEMGDYEYEKGNPMYEIGDRAYCNGVLSDGRTFLAEHYFSENEQKDYLIVVLPAANIIDIGDYELNITKQERQNVRMHQCFHSVFLMELDEILWDLLNTEYRNKVTKYMLQQGIITDENARCDCLYIAPDRIDNCMIVACYEIPNLKGCGLKMQSYREDTGGR